MHNFKARDMHKLKRPHRNANLRAYGIMPKNRYVATSCRKVVLSVSMILRFEKFYLPYFLLKLTINHFPSAGFGCTLASSYLACFLPFTFLSIKNVPVVNSSIFKEYIPKKSIVKSSTLLQLIKSCYTLSCMTLTHIATMMRSFHVS